MQWGRFSIDTRLLLGLAIILCVYVLSNKGLNIVANLLS